MKKKQNNAEKKQISSDKSTYLTDSNGILLYRHEEIKNQKEYNKKLEKDKELEEIKQKKAEEKRKLDDKRKLENETKLKKEQEIKDLQLNLNKATNFHKISIQVKYYLDHSFIKKI